jgi:hypothetical protein
LQCCWKVKLIAWVQRSMAIHIQDIIYLQVESSLVGLVLFKPYKKLKMKIGTFYKNVKGLKTCHVKKCSCIVQFWFNMIHNHIWDFDIVLTICIHLCDITQHEIWKWIWLQLEIGIWT